VAKAANLGITKDIPAEFGKYGIRYNDIMILPLELLLPSEIGIDSQQRVDIVRSTPLGRPGKSLMHSVNTLVFCESIVSEVSLHLNVEKR
jgi:hypothetical protein